MALTPQFGSLVPSSTQQLLATNYLQFNTGAGADFAQQYLPEIYEQEVERYGNRTLSGFLRMVGAEMPMTSDQVIWSEQNRLHIAYDNCILNAGVIEVAPAAGAATLQNVISVNDTVVILDTVTGAEQKGIVTASVPAVVGGANGSNWQYASTNRLQRSVDLGLGQGNTNGMDIFGENVSGADTGNPSGIGMVSVSSTPGNTSFYDINYYNHGTNLILLLHK